VRRDDVLRVASWATFGGITYAIRDLFPLILGTYLLTLAGNQAVGMSQRAWRGTVGRVKGLERFGNPPRKAFCVGYIAIALGIVGATGSMFIPRVVKEAQFVVARISQTDNP
jgi:hypothetical protein